MLNRPIAILLGIASLLIVPASAAAVDICVKQTGCAAEHTWDDLAAAAADANDETERPRVRVGAGQFTNAGAVSFTKAVDIVGAGRDQTFVSPSAGQFALVLSVAGSTLEDLSFKLPDFASAATLINAGTVRRSDVTVNNPTSTALHYGHVVQGVEPKVIDSVITLHTEGTNYGLYSVGATNALLENVRARAQVAVYSTSGTAAVRQSSLEGPYGARQDAGGTLKVSSTLIRVSETPVTDEAALFALAGNGQTALIDADHVTIVGAPQVAGNIGAAAHAQYTGSCDPAANNTGSTSIRLTNSLIDDIPNRVHFVGCAAGDCSVDPTVSPGVRSANIRMDQVRYQTFGQRAATGGCNSFVNGFFGAPGFISDADQRLRGSSGAVDSGKPGVLAPGEVDKDLLGKSRIVDGDGNGSAVRDLGAYEYQRQAPTVTAAVTPASGPPGTTFRFTSTGSDADGEDVSFVWTFDDGVAVQGQNVEKSWSSLGAHSATVQVKDDGGVVTTRTADVTVVDPPKPVVTVVPTPVPDTTAPVITLTGGTFTVSAKRVVKLKLSCNETATGVLSAKSARKVKLKRRAKAKILSLGSKAYSCAPGAPVTVSLKLSAAAFKYLKKVKRLKVALAATGKDAAGNAGTATGKATFKAPRKRR